MPSESAGPVSKSHRRFVLSLALLALTTATDVNSRLAKLSQLGRVLWDKQVHVLVWR